MTKNENAGFLAVPELSADVERVYAADVEQFGFVMNLSRMWAHQPAIHDGLFDLMGQAVRGGSLKIGRASCRERV